MVERDELAMDGKNEGRDNEQLDDQQSDYEDTLMMEALAKVTDNVGEASVEIDVESLVAEFEAEASDGVDASGRVRRRLEAIIERKRRHQELADFDDYDLDTLDA